MCLVFYFRGDVKIHQSRPLNTAALQGHPTVRGPDLLRLSGPVTTS